uniref:Putative reverse transcriptase domain-containing protein n=1 Tax=Tanacetum cinerariifolium TaxID=118510 RepID=A0A699IJ75_TANCI|nr:putative reverse transcriptase domain-containing protein [Tanacetum cinerariifolium]
MDREVKKLKQSRIPIVKVRWNSRQGPEYTWEREDQMKSKIPPILEKLSSIWEKGADAVLCWDFGPLLVTKGDRCFEEESALKIVMENLPPDHNEFAPAAEAAPDNMNGWVEWDEDEEDPEEDPKIKEEEEGRWKLRMK